MAKKEKVKKVKKEKITKEKVTKKEKAPKGLNRDKVKPGNVYSIVNTTEVADVDGDQVSDLVLTHKVTCNGDNFVDSKTVWYGLEPEVLDAVLALVDELGLVTVEPIEVTKFNQLIREWRKVTQLLKAMNDLGDVQAEQMGEDIEEEDEVEVVEEVEEE